MTDGREYQLDCLARWVLSNWKTKTGRQDSLRRMEKRHGVAFADDIRDRMMKEYRK